MLFSTCTIQRRVRAWQVCETLYGHAQASYPYLAVFLAFHFSRTGIACRLLALLCLLSSLLPYRYHARLGIFGDVVWSRMRADRWHTGRNRAWDYARNSAWYYRDRYRRYTNGICEGCCRCRGFGSDRRYWQRVSMGQDARCARWCTRRLILGHHLFIHS